MSLAVDRSNQLLAGADTLITLLSTGVVQLQCSTRTAGLVRLQCTGKESVTVVVVGVVVAVVVAVMVTVVMAVVMAVVTLAVKVGSLVV